MGFDFIKKVPFLGKKAVQAYSYYRRFTNKKYLRQNRALVHSESGKRAFILATGPSINTQDLKPLNSELCISVSNFFLHPDFKRIQPNYHVFAPSHHPITEAQYVVLIRDAEHHFPERQNVLLSITDKYVIEKHQLLAKANIYYYFLGHKALGSKREIDFTTQIPAIQTSPHIAIYLALYLGAKEINLLGVDHDWILHLNESRHFYKEKESALSKMGYDEAWERSKDYQTEFEDYVRLWKRYKDIRSYAGKRNVNIFNCTPQSLLDVFPRKKMEDALHETTKQV